MHLWMTTKTILHKHENFTNILKIKHKKNQGKDPMVLCAPWSNYFINNQNNDQNMDNKTKMTSCWKGLDPSLNNCEVITQWAFVPLGPTLTYTTSKLNNLRNFPESNQFIYVYRCYHKNRPLATTFHKPVWRRKSVCPVWIRPTDNLWSHLRTSFRIN